MCAFLCTCTMRDEIHLKFNFNFKDNFNFNVSLSKTIFKRYSDFYKDDVIHCYRTQRAFLICYCSANSDRVVAFKRSDLHGTTTSWLSNCHCSGVHIYIINLFEKHGRVT